MKISKRQKFINASIILMAMSLTRRPIVVLDFKADIEDFTFDAKEVYNSMNSDPMFGGLAGKLGQLNADILLLEAAHAGMHSVPPTHTVGDRDVELQKVKTDLRSLKIDVQVLVDATPANAQAIVDSAKMKLKQAGAINKQNFAAKNGQLSTTVELIAKGMGSVRYANEWAVSFDGTNWTQLTSTLAAHTLATGLARASIVDFRHRYIFKDGPSEWLYIYDWLVN